MRRINAGAVTALLLLTCPSILSTDKNDWLYHSSTLKNLRHTLSVSSSSSQSIYTSESTTKETATNPSDFQWFQDIFYPNPNCEGNPYRIFDFALGDCFKDTSHTSFMFALNPEATIVYSTAYADDHCGVMSHNETDAFEGIAYEGPDSVAPCLRNPYEAPSDDFHTSLRTIAYKTPHVPVYPASGYVSRIYIGSDCRSQLVSGNWYSIDNCISRSAADIDPNTDASLKRFQFSCNDGFPELHSFKDDQCATPSKRYPPHRGKFSPRCDPSWAPFTKYTPTSGGNEMANCYMTTYCYESTSVSPVESFLPSLSPTLSPSLAPSEHPAPVSKPTEKPHSMALSYPPTLRPVALPGADESAPGSSSNGGDSGSGADNSLFLMDSLSTELLIIMILTSAAFCMCAGTLVCFLCLRLHSQDSLNRDLMQTFAQLVDRNRRALRSVQEKFSQKPRRENRALRLRETELHDRESRALLKDSKQIQTENVSSSKKKKSRSMRATSTQRQGQRQDHFEGSDNLDEDANDEYIDSDEDELG